MARKWDWDWSGTSRRKVTAEKRAKKWRERGYEAKIEYIHTLNIWYVYMRKKLG